MSRAELRETDQAVLKAGKQGKDDTQKITQSLALKTHQVRYSLEKLEQHGLLQIETQDGYTTRTINGQKRTFKTPKQARLTPQGEEFEFKEEEKDLAQYDNMSHSELVQRIHPLETHIENLEKSFQLFKKQVQRRYRQKYFNNLLQITA